MLNCQIGLYFLNQESRVSWKDFSLFSCCLYFSGGLRPPPPCWLIVRLSKPIFIVAVSVSSVEIGKPWRRAAGKEPLLLILCLTHFTVGFAHALPPPLSSGRRDAAWHCPACGWDVLALSSCSDFFSNRKFCVLEVYPVLAQPSQHFTALSLFHHALFLKCFQLAWLVKYTTFIPMDFETLKPLLFIIHGISISPESAFWTSNSCKAV